MLKNNVLRAEEVSYSAWVKYADETEMVKQLQAQFKVADSLRQEAWVKFQSLKKHFYEKVWVLLICYSLQYVLIFNVDW